MNHGTQVIDRGINIKASVFFANASTFVVISPQPDRVNEGKTPFSSHIVHFRSIGECINERSQLICR